jgi:hypothetical protein
MIEVFNNGLIYDSCFQRHQGPRAAILLTRTTASRLVIAATILKAHIESVSTNLCYKAEA